MIPAPVLVHTLLPHYADVDLLRPRVFPQSGRHHRENIPGWAATTPAHLAIFLEGDEL